MITQAYAQEVSEILTPDASLGGTASQATGSSGSLAMQFMPLVLIFLVFYFLLIRPQQKRLKAHQEMVKSLEKGDQVITAGGMIGTITDASSEMTLKVKLADGVEVQLMRSTISEKVIDPEMLKGKGSSKESPAQKAA